MKREMITLFMYSLILVISIQNNLLKRCINPENPNSYYDDYFKNKYNQYNQLPSNDLNNNSNENNYDNNINYYFDDDDYYNHYHEFKYYDKKYDYFDHNYYDRENNE